MNEYFGFCIDTSNCTNEDVVNLTACFLNEDIKRFKLGEYDIYFTRVVTILDSSIRRSLGITDGFNDKDNRLLIIEDGKGNEIMHMTMNYDMTRKLKENLKHQLNVFKL